MRLTRITAGVIALGLVAACAREEILPGERFGLREELPPLSADLDAPVAPAQPDVPENRAEPISLPAPVNHAAWTHRAGTPEHAIAQPAFARAPQVLWSVRVGQGNDRKHRITADPVAANGVIYAMDSRARVTAVSAGGDVLWSVDLTPAGDRADEASGGGLALAGGRLLVSTGFGTLVALEAGSGAKQWVQKLDAPVGGAPTVADGVAYVVSRDNQGYAVDIANGRVLWRYQGTPDLTGVLGAASPAVAGDLVLLPFSSGQLVALARADGALKWSTHVAGRRPGRGYSLITDITGEPVVAGGVVYAGNSVGRTMALSRAAGARIWDAREGAAGPVWVAGGSVFLISDEARLVRLDARDGSRIWAIDLPYYTREKPRKRRAIHANYGPVLAGGLLWVASSDGMMRGFDPVDGALVSSVEVPGGASSRLIVVDGTGYLVTTRGDLLALR